MRLVICLFMLRKAHVLDSLDSISPLTEPSLAAAILLLSPPSPSTLSVQSLFLGYQSFDRTWIDEDNRIPPLRDLAMGQRAYNFAAWTCK